MNCKPGDLAIIIADAPGDSTAGRIVEILHRAPTMPHRLPCGTKASASGPESWVVKFQRPVRAPMAEGGTRLAIYAACPDRYLRPLHPPEQVETTSTTNEEPSHA